MLHEIEVMTMARTMAAEELIELTTRTLHQRAGDMLVTVLRQSEEANVHIRDWANHANLADIVVVDGEYPRISTVVIPLFLLDLALAATGLSEKKRIEEAIALTPHIQAGWDAVFTKGTTRDYNACVIEAPMGDVIIDPISDALRYVRAWGRATA